MGLMQIMPETWSDLRARYDLGADPYDPHDNILAGAAYLREMLDRYGPEGVLAAYNAGPARYDRHLATGRPLPHETQAYVNTLAPIVNGNEADRPIAGLAQSPVWATSPVFAVRTASNPHVDRASPSLRPDRQSSARAAVDLSALVPQSRDLFVRRAGKVRSQ